MYRLNLFDRKLDTLSSSLNFGRLMTYKTPDGRKFPYIICKDGGLMLTMKYRGPDLDSAITEELAMITLRLQNAIASIDTNWHIWFEAERIPSTNYPKENFFPDPVTKGMELERRTLFSGGTYFESNFYATLYYLPPTDNRERVKAIMIEGREKKEIDASDLVSDFIETANKVYAAFRHLSIPAEFLTENEFLTYIHSTVSEDARRITPPKKPMLMDQYLFDTPLYGGFEPRLGKKHIRIIAPIDFAKDTSFGYFDAFNQMNFAYRWVTRCSCLSKADVLSVLESLKKRWKGKLQSIISLITHRQNNTENNDENILAKLEEVREAKNAVEADTISYIFATMAIIVMDEDREIVEEKAKQVRQVFVNLGMKAKIEDVNALDAWFSCVPGMVYPNERRPLISTGNLIHMMPLSDIWAGHEKNKHLNAPPLIYTQTTGNTPFRLNLHVGDVGHSLIVGPTGSGKSVLLNCLEASFRRYKNASVIIFDKGSSSKVLTMGVGGNFYDLGNSSQNGGLSFQPLSGIDDENERQWAQEWLADFLRGENLEVTPEIKGFIRDALGTLATMDKKFRTMTGFVGFLQDIKLKQAFSPLCLDDGKGNKGEYSMIFDSTEDNLEISQWQTFEMEKLMETKGIVSPALMYIFHRIEQSLTGNPTLILLDECWVFFDNEMFAQKIREWLKVLRKSDCRQIHLKIPSNVIKYIWRDFNVS
ncbi:MAG: conjugal transfer protein TrbE [Selenomonadaceae bacterium]|nr:conjugal transfer protein TrbE [Selenomonadaceae bacterium]